MKYIRIIAIGLILFLASSCAVDYLEFPSEEVNSSDEITVIGHITRFDDYEVATRSAKNEDEVKITSFAMAIFEVIDAGPDARAGACVHYEYHENTSQLLFTVDRSNSKYGTGKKYAIYVFANIPKMKTYDPDEGFDITQLSLDTLLSESIAVKGLNIPENGFPMLGSLGDTFSTIIDKDGKTFVMSPTIGDQPPTVNNEAASTLNIPIKALYAKINFEIEVRPDQTIQDSFAPQFTLKNYKIVNVPDSLDFKNSTNADTDESIGVLDTITVQAGNPIASGANTIKFSFYLPENLLTSAIDTLTYDYPFKKNGTIRAEDLKYRQRYKSKLLRTDQKATHIVMSGEFRDHQNHSVNVDYTIHLGKDNFSDFNIVRNCEYSNYITIKGILNSSDNEDNYISLDHRVNVEHKQPSIVSLRREVLLDSHYEIRPIRIKKSNYAGDNLPNALKVEVVNPSTTTWMRVERSFGDGIEDGDYPMNDASPSVPIYITADDITDSNYAPKGKRRYFTHNLITGGENAGKYDHPLNNSTEAIVPLDDDGECVWLYVDECTEVGDGTRSGVIRMTYGNLSNDGKFTEINSEDFPQVNYAIIQRKLFEVKNGNYQYHIEYEEEYLHNFDSEDIYGNTDEEGMVWGLDGAQLSFDNKAVVFNTGEDWASGLTDYIINSRIANVTPYYDFYIDKYDDIIMPTESYRSNREGYKFCIDIIKDINTKNNPNRDTQYDGKIDVLALNEQPSSAIEYCFNKNKRNSKGQVIWENSDGSLNTDSLNWYLPAIDEIEDIVMGKYEDADGNEQNSYARFLDFQNKYYWSCQPAYIPNLAHYSGSIRIIIEWALDEEGNLYIDDINNARATKVSYANSDYTETTSGAQGYESVIFFEGTSEPIKYNLVERIGDGDSFSYTYQKPFIFWQTTETKTITKDKIIKYDDGHQARTKKNRIRCVRRIQQQ